MDSSSFPTLDQVRDAHPGELAVLLSTLHPDDVTAADGTQCEAVVVATQRVASWCHGLQAVAVDRFAEIVVDEQEAHAAELNAAREAQRAEVEGSGGTWRGSIGAVALPEPHQIAASSLAPLLQVSPRTMRTRLNRARGLMELPRTLDLALAGVLQPWRVDAVVVAARDVTAERLAEYEARLHATDVTELPKPRLAERARKAALRADPEGVEAGVRRAPRRRGLRVAPSEVLGLMRWTLEVPDDQSQRLFSAVDELAQEYLAADRLVVESGSEGDSSERGERRSVEAARLDALTDLAMANVHVETVVELVVPVEAGSATTVTRPDPRAAAAAFFSTPTTSLTPTSLTPTSLTPTSLTPTSVTSASVTPASVTPASVPTASATTSAGSVQGIGARETTTSVRHTADASGSTESGARGHQGDPTASPDSRHGVRTGVVVDEVVVDEVLVDLVLGNVTHATLEAGQLERSHGLRCGSWLETASNPFLATGPPPHKTSRVSLDPPGSVGSPSAHDRPRSTEVAGDLLLPHSTAPPSSEPPGERVWFVDGLVEAPGAAALLPQQVVALLGDPDTVVRVRSDRPGASDGTPRQRRRYRPRKQLASRVRARDLHCRFPGCSVPAARCQLDHVVPHPAGETSEGNLHCLCPAHHGFKHHAGWRLTMTADGTCTWTAPTGRRHTTVPSSRRDLAA